MPQRHQILTGSFFPDLETALRNSVHAFAQKHAPLTPMPVLVPSNLLKVYLRRRLVEMGLPHIGVQFLTLQELTARMLSAGSSGRETVSSLAEELLADSLVRQNVEAESYFGSVRHAAGFRRSLLAAFKDLKEAGIGPAEFSALASRKTKLNRSKFTQLATLFAEYDRLLREHKVEDSGDALWRAAESWQDFAETGAELFVYGFYDFNYLQRRLVARISVAHPLTVFFPYHPSESSTPEHIGGAYVYAEPTLRWFEALLGVEADPVSGDPDLIPQTLSDFRARLFNEPREEPMGKPMSANIEIISDPHEPAEAREVLREAIAFCVDEQEKTRPARRLFNVAVLPRQSEPFADLFDETAQARAVPLHIAAGLSLANCFEARSFFALLDVAASGLGRSALMAFATMAPLDHARILPTELQVGFAPAEWDRLSAEIGVTGGLKNWRQRLDSHLGSIAWRRANPYPEDADSELAKAKLERDETVTRALKHFIDSVAAMLKPLLSEAFDGDGMTVPNAFAWSRLVSITVEAAKKMFIQSDPLGHVIAAVEQLAGLEDFQPAVSIEQFTNFVRRALEDETVRETSFEDGGIFVGGLMAARGLSWPMVVVPGLVEKTFPRVSREDPILLDAEREEINRLMPDDTLPSSAMSQPSLEGEAFPLRLDLKRRGHDEERLLFQLAVESARERLVLTFPRLDTSSGRPRTPSMLLLYAAEALTGKAADYSLLEKCPVFRRVRLGAARDGGGHLLDDTEQNLSLFSALQNRKIRRIGPLLRGISPAFFAGLRCEQTRWRTNEFTRYDGVFEGRAAKSAVSDALDPAANESSATAFELFARCPRCFFERHLLGIDKVDEPEEAVLLPPREVGSLVHYVLSDAMRRLGDDGLLPLKRAEHDKHWKILRAVAEKWFAEFERRGFTGIPLLWEVQREWMLADFREFLLEEYEAQADGTMPVMFEHPFGRNRHAEPGEPVSPSVLVKIKGGGALRFCGRIDRLDRLPDGGFRVIDYKTGKCLQSEAKLKKSPLMSGTMLQIPIYILAAQHLGGKASAGELYYATARGNFARLRWDGDVRDAALAELPSMLSLFHGAMTDGIFFQSPGCEWCGGSAMSQAAVETLFEMKQDDSRIASLLEGISQ